jgi:hypothetical protein
LIEAVIDEFSYVGPHPVEMDRMTLEANDPFCLDGDSHLPVLDQGNCAIMTTSYADDPHGATPSRNAEPQF